MWPNRLTVKTLLTIVLLAVTAFTDGCVGSEQSAPLAPFNDFFWGATPSQVAERHGYPAEAPERLKPDGLFWSYNHTVWDLDAIIKYYFKFNRLTASYCFLEVPDLSADRATVLIRRTAAQIESQMLAPLMEEISRDKPFTNIQGNTYMTREIAFTLIDKKSYVCISGTWWDSTGKLSLNVTMMRYDRSNPLIRDTEKRLKTLMEADAEI